MKKLYLFLQIVFAFVILLSHSEAQSPSKTTVTVLSEYASSSDTVTFNEYPIGTQITNQYLSMGVLFSGVGGNPPPEVYDFGSSSYGRVLISHNWYDGILIKFVEPLDSTVYRPVSSISFDNPITEEVDYITVKIYNTNDSLLFTYTSASPERVEINLGNPVGAYMILDDSAGTAYVVDNLTFNTTALGVKDNPDRLMKDIMLYPNYPNPFNPLTKIRYSIPSSQHVTLKVYDIVGREIMTLVDGIKPVGIHNELLDASLLPSGVYFYRLQAGIFSETKKLLITK